MPSTSRYPAPCQLKLLALGVSWFCMALPAHGFDPNLGAEAASNAAPRYQAPAQYLPAHIVPSRYYVPSANPMASAAPAINQPVIISPPPIQAAIAAPMPVAPEYIAPAYVAPTPVYAQPFVAAAATTIAPLPDVYEVPAAQPIAAAEMVRAPKPYYMQVSAPAFDKNRFSLGVEGYYDEYREKTVQLKDEGEFVGLSASYEHFFNENIYSEIDLRAAYGNTDYSSISGTIDDINQWETENRILFGYHGRTPSGQGIVKTYLGLGQRYFVDELKGKVASLGALGYERRIFQLYIPLGVTYEFRAYGLTFAPNIEVDPIIYGNVQSRLQTIPGFEVINNQQKSGIGWRAEFMVGQRFQSGTGWQFGPFVRYWNVPDSDFDTNGSVPPGFGFIEPKNTRLQVGAKLKYLF